MNIYSIRNEKLGFSNRPIYCESFSEALSYIQNVLMSDADRALLGLKDDLSLYELGSFDAVDNIIHGYEKPMFICSLREIFDSIPADKLPRDAKILQMQIDELYSRVGALDGLKAGDIIDVEK